MRIGRTLGIVNGGGSMGRPVSGVRVEPAAVTAPTGDEAPREEPENTSRALAPLAPSAASSAGAGERLLRYRIDAPFVAQLIANRDGLPETRRLRRAPSAHAAAVYAAAMEGPGLLVPGYLVDTAL